ncbi:hypothetical protein [Providencia manganoxydans]|uniref:hypothetical protein n=1 Tax=Providencia manganoxydans TaxID=2923283 RepID=UPI0034E45EAC
MNIKSFLYTFISIVSVLFFAYSIGGRAARKAIEAERKQVEIDRLAKTVNIKKEVDGEIHSKDDDSVINELRSDWMRK